MDNTPQKHNLSRLIKLSQLWKNSNINSEVLKAAVQYIYTNKRPVQDIIELFQTIPSAIHASVIDLREMFFQDPKTLAQHLTHADIVRQAGSISSEIPYYARFCQYFQDLQREEGLEGAISHLSKIASHTPEDVMRLDMLSQKDPHKDFMDILSKYRISKRKQQQLVKAAESQQDLKSIVQHIKSIPHEFRSAIFNKDVLEKYNLEVIAKHLQSNIEVELNGRKQPYCDIFLKELQGSLQSEADKAAFKSKLEKIGSREPKQAWDEELIRHPISFQEANSSDSEYDAELITLKNSGSVIVGQLPQKLQELAKYGRPFIFKTPTRIQTIADMKELPAETPLKELHSTIQPREIKHLRQGCIILDAINNKGKDKQYIISGLPSRIIDNFIEHIQSVQSGLKTPLQLPYFKIDFIPDLYEQKHFLDAYPYDPENVLYYDRWRNGASIAKLKREEHPSKILKFHEGLHRSALPPGLCTYSFDLFGSPTNKKNNPPDHEGRLGEFLYDKNSGVAIAEIYSPAGTSIAVVSKDFSEAQIQELALQANQALQPNLLFEQSKRDASRVTFRSAGPDYIKMYSEAKDGAPTSVQTFPLLNPSERDSFIRFSANTENSGRQLGTHLFPYTQEKEAFERENTNPGNTQRVRANKHSENGKIASILHNELTGCTIINFLPQPSKPKDQCHIATLPSLEHKKTFAYQYHRAAVCAVLPPEVFDILKEEARKPDSQKKDISFSYLFGTFEIDGRSYSLPASKTEADQRSSWGRGRILGGAATFLGSR